MIPQAFSKKLLSTSSLVGVATLTLISVIFPAEANSPVQEDTYQTRQGAADQDAALSTLADGCKDKDWSWARSKLSCPAGFSINGIAHSHEDMGRSHLKAHCGTALQTDALTCEGKGTKWKWLELADTNFGGPFDCGHGWYMAGVSFVAVDNTQGLKSLLCIKESAPRTTEMCDWKNVSTNLEQESRCGFNGFIRGVETEAIGGGRSCFNSQRNDDRNHPRCDRIKRVKCCERKYDTDARLE